MNVSAAENGNVIASIHIGKKKVVVTLGDGSSFSLSENAFTEMPLYEGKELSDEEMKSLQLLASEDKFVNLANRYVTKESHTVYETKLYLIKKGADVPMANRIVAHLEELGYLDDRLYAQAYARDVAGLRLFGRSRILAELKQRGIDDDVLADLSFDPEKELSKARRYARLANTKYAKNTNIKKMYKVISALLRRGFDQEIAKEAARLELTSGDPDLERAQLKTEALRAKARYSRSCSGYVLNQKILAYLSRRGYPYENIKEVLKEMEDENI